MGVLRRRWVWMLSVLMVGLGATTTLVLLAEPTYVAEATVIISQQQIPQAFVQSTVKEDTLASVNAMVGQVLSHEHLMGVIEQLGLFPEERKKGATVDLVAKLRSRVVMSPQSTSRRQRNDDAIVYSIVYRSTDPTETADVANALASLFVDTSIERRSSQARRATGFLRRSLERDEAVQRERAAAVSEFRRKYRGELPSELETNLRRLQLLSERRQALNAQIASKEGQILTLAASPPAQDLSESAVLLDELRRNLARESAVNTEEHPNVIALREQVAQLQKVVARERTQSPASRLLASERRELEILKTQLAETQIEIDDLSERVDRTPAIGEQIAVLEQRELVSRENYLASLRKVEEAELAESLESAQQGALVTVLDRARKPTAPEQPRALLAVIGVGASLFLALGLGVLLELVDPVIVSSSQLERLCEGSYLGSMPITT
jgi:uncharacterized protein involved in exopolysaccharide biosynthesis